MGELSARQVARAVYVQRVGELADGQLLLLDTIGDLAHDLEHELEVGASLLRLDDSLGHVLLHAAGPDLRSDI